MRYDPDKKHRQSIRLRDYDYSQNGAYFVTLCVQDRQPLFGSVVDSEICLDANGLLAQSTWIGLITRFPSVFLDEFVLMPNHLHGIVLLTHRQAPGEKILNLGEVIRAFKAVTTRNVRQSGRPDFAWQRNYYEHIVRDEHDLLRIQQYIENNPVAWADDEENPEGHPM